MTTITVSVSFDSTSTNPEVGTAVALLLASLGVSAPHDVVVLPAKTIKPKKVLTAEEKQAIRDRFAKGKANAQAKRDAEVAKLTKPVGGNAADKAREKALNQAKDLHKGVRPQPAPKK
jgi:hypothetical protein